MTTKIGWELYRAFLSVLKEGSLSAAARALDTTQPTVGRHIEALEQALNVVLFTRSQLGLTPTAVALEMRAYAEAMEHTAASIERAASGQGTEVAGVVRVTASEVIAVEVLPPVIRSLLERYPGLRVELVLSNRVQDLLQREADIAVRMLQPRQEQLIARRVGTIELGMFAHPDYLRRCGAPRTIAALKEHAFIGFDEVTPFIRAASKNLAGLARKDFAVATDSNLGQLALLRGGVGIGICQTPLAKRAPTLTRLLPRQYAMQMETWVTMHEDLRNSPRCKAVFDALVSGLQAYVQS